MNDFGIASSGFLGILSTEWWKDQEKLARNWPLLSWALENDSNQNIRVNISFNGEFDREVTTEKLWFVVVE